jgi:hypothetical protein
VYIAVSGSVYVIGAFRGTADFDQAGVGYSMTSAGVNDVFIIKLGAAGNFLCAKRFDGIGDDVGNSIKTDAAKNVYISGYYSDTVDFDPGSGTYHLNSAGNGLYTYTL